ncbi:MAG: hypothetical protein HW421_3006 [Ignavibacteria bacterium]|nr:hypothetical protein [Ignavibacteria bacterium]
MKILLDENIPINLKRELSDFEVFTVRDMNWDSYKNGDLLKSAIQSGFNVLITTDKNLQFQQNIKKFKIAVIVLDVLLLKWSYIEPLLPHIIELLPNVENGQIYII